MKAYIVRRLLNKKRTKYNGWKLHGSEIKKQINAVLISPSDEEFVVESVYKFCKEKKLKHPNVYKLIKGEISSCEGWKIKANDV